MLMDSLVTCRKRVGGGCMDYQPPTGNSPEEGNEELAPFVPDSRRARRLLGAQNNSDIAASAIRETQDFTSTPVTPQVSQNLPILTSDVLLLLPVEQQNPGREVLGEKDTSTPVARPRARQPRVSRRLSLAVPRVGRFFRRATKNVWSFGIRGGAVVFVGALFLTIALPSTGLNLTLPGYAVTTKTAVQEATASNSSDVATTVILESYKTSNFGNLFGRRYGSRNYTYTVKNSGEIRWPFLFAAPISSGFGHRQSPCPTCSSYHTGLDFNPDEGTEIYAVATGTVIEVEHLTYSYGNHLVLRHNVNGMLFDTLYAHMLPGSLELKVGDVVEAGDYVGRVGDTGNSTGAHLHLEIIVDGNAIDPFTWLKKNAK